DQAVRVRRSAEFEPGRDAEACAGPEAGSTARAAPGRFRDLRERLRELVVHGAVSGHVVVDELGRAFCGGEESRDGDGDADSFEIPARLFFDRWILYARGGAEAKGSARGVVEHGRSVH